MADRRSTARQTGLLRRVPVGQNACMDLVVAADDRTGAFEVAGRLADGGNGTVTVTAWPDLPGDGTGGSVAVVDLGSRHLSPGEARERARASEWAQ